MNIFVSVSCSQPLFYRCLYPPLSPLDETWEIYVKTMKTFSLKLFNLHSCVWFHSNWTQGDTLTSSLIFLCLYVCCGHNAPLPCSSYVSLCLHVRCVCVFVCFFRKCAWHEACWSRGVHASSLPSGEDGFNRGRQEEHEKNTKDRTGQICC